MKYKLSEVAYYSREKIEVKALNSSNYLSTENILPNFGGITTAASLPAISSVARYSTGDILLSNIRPYFKKLYFATSEGGCSNDVLCICVKENIDKKFLYYSLKNDDFFKYVMVTAKGTKMPRGDKSAIMNYEFEVPNLETQQKIVRILSALDSKIELNNARCEMLRQFSACIFSNFIKNIKNSKKITIGELCNIKYGKNLPSKNLLKSGYPVYGANGIIGYYDKKTYNSPQVLVSCRGVAGAVHISEPECFVTNNSLILECDDRYHHFIKEYSLSRRYDDYATGSAQPQITIKNIKDHELYIPENDTELNILNKQCDPIEKQFFAIIAQNKKLNKLRDILLPKLMNSEINLEGIK